MGITPLLLCLAAGRMFYPDDPLMKEPRPIHVKDAQKRKVEDYFDFLHNTLVRPGIKRGVPAMAVNTLGEPMDGAWYTHRHYFHRMSAEELARGPGGRTPPADGPWTVVRAKSEGITPGFTIVDRNNNRYFLKFDPVTNLEMATAADMISGRFFHALGYHVADQYLVYFDEQRLVLGKGIQIADEIGRKRPMTRRDLLEVLLKTRKNNRGLYRAVASRAIDGKDLGPFRYFGLRKDDPNDTVPHEHRRDLRGLMVPCAWLNHDDSRAINTFDALVTEDGVQYIRHYLLDFGSTLGSASTGPNKPRGGGEYLFDWGLAAKNILTLGLIIPRWARAKYPQDPSIGHFESATFDPARWVPEYPNAAFENRLPDDEFWGAKQVMAFSDDHIRAIVRTGELSDPRSEEYLVRTLIERRDKIGRAFVERVLPLDGFEVRDGRLVFRDVGSKRRELSIAWRTFDNATGQRGDTIEGRTFEVPRAAGDYWVAEIAQAGDNRRTIAVYVRKKGGGYEVAGVERRW